MRQCWLAESRAAPAGMASHSRGWGSLRQQGPSGGTPHSNWGDWHERRSGPRGRAPVSRPGVLNSFLGAVGDFPFGQVDAATHGPNQPLNSSTQLHTRCDGDGASRSEHFLRGGDRRGQSKALCHPTAINLLCICGVRVRVLLLCRAWTEILAHPMCVVYRLVLGVAEEPLQEKPARTCSSFCSQSACGS